MAEKLSNRKFQLSFLRSFYIINSKKCQSGVMPMKQMLTKWMALLLILLMPLFATAETAPAYVDLGENIVRDWDAFYAWLDENPQLTQVDMFATTIDRKHIEALDERYPGITFGWTMEVGDHLVRTDASCFSTLHRSGDESHKNYELNLLRFCRELRALDIGHNSAEDLSFLYDLPELRVLIVACNRVKDITPIGSLSHLEYLEIFSNYIEDISPLKDLPYLAHLNIGYNNISDVSPLYEMPQLKRLWIKKCDSRTKSSQLSDQVLAELQEALGDCVIDARHNPSEGGWRECVEFETFHEYFRTGHYVPFPTSPMENR